MITVFTIQMDSSTKTYVIARKPFCLQMDDDNNDSAII